MKSFSEHCMDTLREYLATSDEMEDGSYRLDDTDILSIALQRYLDALSLTMDDISSHKKTPTTK